MLLEICSHFYNFNSMKKSYFWKLCNQWFNCLSFGMCNSTVTMVFSLHGSTNRTGCSQKLQYLKYFKLFIVFISVTACADSYKFSEWSYRSAVIHYGAVVIPRSHGPHLYHDTGDWWQCHACDISCFHITQCYTSATSFVLLECQGRIEGKASISLLLKFARMPYVISDFIF